MSQTAGNENELIAGGRMIALGSSFASGPGISPVADRAAGRSSHNYPHLVAARLGLELTDATIAGATTATILDTPQRVGLRRFAPQVQSVTPDATLVTITAGGNDLGYLRSVLTTALRRSMSERLPGVLARRIGQTRPRGDVSHDDAERATRGLERIVHDVRQRAPHSRIVLVDYLPIFTAAPPTSGIPFTANDVGRFRGTADTLSAVFTEAARRTGADVVTATDYSQDHGTGTATPWVFGLQPMRQLTSSFHPTAEGMDEIARALGKHLTNTSTNA